MYNAFFDDVNLNLSLKLNEFIQQDDYGYFLDTIILKKDVTKLIPLGIIPLYDEISKKFYLKINLNNTTKVTINGIKVDYLGDERLSQLPQKKIVLKELCLKRYSNATKSKSSIARNRSCYSTKAVFTIKLDKERMKK